MPKKCSRNAKYPYVWVWYHGKWEKRDAPREKCPECDEWYYPGLTTTPHKCL